MPLGMLAKSNLNLAMRYVDDIPEEDIDKMLTDIHKIVFLVEGADYEAVADADLFVPCEPCYFDPEEGVADEENRE